jgi:branched-chain amino acid transport system substrate-binding protein
VGDGDLLSACACHRGAERKAGTGAGAICPFAARSTDALLLSALPAFAQDTVKVAVIMSQTGPSQTAGVPVIDAVRLATDEANADGETPSVEFAVYDDHSIDDGAREAAKQAIASDAVVAVGPGTTTSALAAGPLFGEAGMASIIPYAHGGGGQSSPTTFRPIFSTFEMGEALASNLRYAMGATRAVLIFRENGYGRPLAEGFRRVAELSGITATYQGFKTPAEAVELARIAAADPGQPAIVLGMVDGDAGSVLAALRRQGASSLILGTSAIASDAFAERYANEPEAQQDPGFFTDGVYEVSPLIIDSANAETLAFAARWRARFGRDPRWEAAQGYDAARLAIAAARAAMRQAGTSDLKARRGAVISYLASLDSPAHAVASLTGPLWFTQERGRHQPTRIGRFHQALFESAPVQLVPVPTPTGPEIASGSVLDLGYGRFARRQQVVYTGVYLNEVPRIDISQSTFTADFYLWIRFARSAGAGAADPADLDFPDLLRGSFDAGKPAEQGDLDDGTTYRLWRVRGDFKNDFDLHHYPFDRQTITVRLFNARAASDRIVYVRDRRSIGVAGGRVMLDGNSAPAGTTTSGTGPSLINANAASADTPKNDHAGTIALAAFRNLTQWEPLSSEQRRDILVTDSALGNPRLVGVARVRELSGYRLDIELARRTMATLAKTLLPLGIMSLIMLGSLWFPHGLVKEKITVAITAALSGAVLLAAVNSQLGAVGYTMAVEYVFYVFFVLCLLCIVAVLAAERLRVAGRGVAAARAENFTRGLFLVAMIGTAAAAWIALRQW